MRFATNFLIGLSLGRPHEPTGLAVVEVTPGDEPRFHVHELARFEAGTRYRDIAASVRAIATRKPVYRSWVEHVAIPHTKASVRREERERFPVLAIDRTGVGETVADTFREAMPSGMDVYDFVLSAGDVESRGQGIRRYPRRELAGVLQLVVQSRRITVAPTLPHGATLAREMARFKARVSLSAKDEDIAWREGEYDDLVLALAAAVYFADHGGQVIDAAAAAILAGMDPAMWLR
jgi:hypothetical protein